MNDVGIYILTYPGDFHLSTALINSLKFFNPEVPVMIIPGEGFDRSNHPFDVPVMDEPGGFWQEMQHIDRKFWAYQGPFEKFIYIDADIICMRSIAPFVARLKQQDGNFIHVQMTIDDDNWMQAVNDPGHDRHERCFERVRSQIGDVDLLKEFDPDYAPYTCYPFNAGLFASNRLAIDEQAFADLHNREKRFYRDRLDKDFSWRSHDLFFADQGRLNYLVDRLGIERITLYPDAQYYWGGRAREFAPQQVLAGECDSNFIHWAGCPRPSPSLFCRWPLLPLLASGYPELPENYSSLAEIPGYSLWRHFVPDAGSWWAKRRAQLQWTWRDARRIARSRASRLLKSFR